MSLASVRMTRPSQSASPFQLVGVVGVGLCSAGEVAVGGDVVVAVGVGAEVSVAVGAVVGGAVRGKGVGLVSPVGVA